MPTITRSLSARRSADGTAEVFFRFSAGRGEVYRIRTGIRVPASRWNPLTASLAVPRIATQEQADLLALKRELDSLDHWLTEMYSDARAGGVHVDRRWFAAAVKRFHNPEWRETREAEADALLEEYISERRARGLATGAYESMLRTLRRWEAYRGEALSVDAWTAQDLTDFEAFLYREEEIAAEPKWAYLYADYRRGRGKVARRTRNSVSQIMQRLAAFTHWAVRAGVMANSPFERYTIPAQVYGTPYYLTIEERDAVYRAVIDDPFLARQRDVFVFQCLIGCRAGDLLKLTKASVVDGAVEYIAAKTSGRSGRTVRVPLTATALEIVQRYAGEPGERLLPFASYLHYNTSVRKILTLAGVTRTVTVLDPKTRREVQRPLNEIATSHLARRTFIGNLYRQVKDPNLIGALSGHVEGSKAFARYRTIDDEVKRDIVGLLEK